MPISCSGGFRGGEGGGGIAHKVCNSKEENFSLPWAAPTCSRSTKKY